MKKGTIFLGMALYLFSAGIISAQEAPVAISPGSEVGIAKVGTTCPTFSWTSVDGAAAYRVEVFKAMEGAVLRVRPKAMTVAVILAGLAPIMIGEGTGSEVMQRIAAPMLGGMITAPLLSLFVVPVIYLLWKRRNL